MVAQSPVATRERRRISSMMSAKVKFRGRPAVRQENCQGLLSAASVIRQAQVERRQTVLSSRMRRKHGGQLVADPGIRRAQVNDAAFLASDAGPVPWPSPW